MSQPQRFTEPELIVDASVSVMHSGAQPDIISALNAGAGKGNTVTVTVFVTAGEQPSVAVTVYVVVAVGVTFGLLIVVLLNPVAGVHV